MPTLYVTEPGTQVHKMGERLVLVKGQDVVEEIPMIHVDQVVMMGRGVGLTTAAMFALVKKGADIVYLTRAGRFVSRLAGSEHKHSRLRHSQALMVSDLTRTIDIAVAIVEGKINNQRTLVRRHAEGSSWASGELAGMDAMMKRVSQSRNLDEVRGFEGQAAKNYYALMRRLLSAPRDGTTWGFERRAYYPPTDPINALLSFGYTLLLNDMVAACQITGLDPALGCFHAIDYGRPSMALDLIEEFRPVIVDSVVLWAVNRNQFELKDFRQARQRTEEDENEDDEQENSTGAGRTGQVEQPAHSIYLTDEARKRFLSYYEERITSQVQYPLSGENTSYRRILLLQAQQMARVISGEAGAYRPVMIR